MQNQYRWLYIITISIVILVVGFICVVKPGWQELRELQSEETRLLRKLTLAKQRNSAQQPMRKTAYLSSQADKLPYWTEMLALISMSGMRIVSVNATMQQSTQSHSAELVRLVAEGNFLQLTKFVNGLISNAYPVVITDFSCKTRDKNKFSAELNMLMFKRVNMHASHHSDEVTVKLHDPFCISRQLPVDQEDDAVMLQSVALNQIKMVGYLQQGQRAAALVLLPANRIIAVQQGLVIGRERGKITAISSSLIHLVLPDSTQQNIRIDHDISA